MSPTISARIPPSLGIDWAASHIAFNPSAPSLMLLVFTPFNAFPKPAKPSPTGVSSLAKSEIDVPPANHDVKPSRTSAAVKMRIADARDLIPSIAFGSTLLAILKNGSRFTMN